MNTNQLKSVLEKIKNYNEFNFEEKIIKQFEESQSMIGEYSLPEYIAIQKRILRQLEEELNSERGIYLPLQYHFHNEYGAGNLQSDIQNLITHLNQGQYANTIGYIKRLIYYQVINGFWDRSTTNIYKIDEVKISEALSRVQHIEKTIKFLSENISKERIDLKKYIDDKKEELEKLELLLRNAETSNDRIADILNDSNNDKVEILSIKEEITAELKNSAANIESQSVFFSKIKTQFKKHETEISNKIEEFESKNSLFTKNLEFIESKKSFFDERIKYLEVLIGREVGASLFETFKQRKVELNSSVTFWKYSVPIMTIAIIIWIYFLFSNGNIEVNQSSEIDWEKYLVNTLKLIPAIILLFFTMRQYKKERDFQEEYAFKSAVALTIDAYSKKISSENTRDSMIVNSVNSIFKSPINAKQNKESLKSKSLLEGINAVKQNMTEMAKDIINITKNGNG